MRGATPLATQISRDDTLRNSVKRKRQITDSTNPGQGVKENETNVAKKQKKDQVGSQPGTPASPQARRERGENILLPRQVLFLQMQLNNIIILIIFILYF